MGVTVRYGRINLGKVLETWLFWKWTKRAPIGPAAHFFLIMRGETYLDQYVVEDNVAVKFDQGKPRFDLLPLDALEEVASVFTYGSNKYADHNWARGGMRVGRLFASAMRHQVAFMLGRSNDPESGLHHVSHAISCLLMIRSGLMRGILVDDRFLLRKESDAEV